MKHARENPWCGFDQCHLALAPCLLILAWVVDATRADAVSNSDMSQLETRSLILGHERLQEKLPFRGGGGQCLYELMDMKGAHWYEVKISYPASVPALFGIELLHEAEDSTSSARKLLNTEKIIFHVGEGSASEDVQVGRTWRVLVSVKPEGFVAQPYVQEQEFIIYNILLEEVVLGIPMQAFWVGFLGLIALCASVFTARQMTTRLQLLQQQLTSESTKRAL